MYLMPDIPFQARFSSKASYISGRLRGQALERVGRGHIKVEGDQFIW